MAKKLAPVTENSTTDVGPKEIWTFDLKEDLPNGQDPEVKSEGDLSTVTTVSHSSAHTEGDVNPELSCKGQDEKTEKDCGRNGRDVRLTLLNEVREKRKKRRSELALQRIAQAARARAAKRRYYENCGHSGQTPTSDDGIQKQKRLSPMRTRSAIKKTIEHNAEETSIDLAVAKINSRQSTSHHYDLSKLPVYLTEKQGKILFSFVEPITMEGPYRCFHCKKIVATKTEAQRHAVGHFRVIRLRCSLCRCGAFFCSDLRCHLQMRQCDRLEYAPNGFVRPGDVTPCMTVAEADQLVEVVDRVKPGRVVFTSGKIVSCENYRPYYPDCEIEEKILRFAPIPFVKEALSIE